MITYVGAYAYLDCPRSIVTHNCLDFFSILHVYVGIDILHQDAANKLNCKYSV
jgi:hypothetical protein